MKKTASRKAAKPAKKAPKRFVKRGYMGSTETVPLAIAAREAFDYQRHLGNVDGQADFKAWRHEQVRACVGRDGLTDCLHEHFKQLLAHFQTLAGKDAAAFANSMQTGPASSKPGDDHEQRRVLAHLIMEVLAAHIWLAEVSAQELATQTESTAAYQKLRARREAIRSHPDGAIREGYIVTLARSKTRRRDLNLGRDLKAGLADRCNVDQLEQIRDTLINRIAAREGIEDNGRNKSQKSPAAKATRSPHDLAPRFDLPDDLPDF
jgi:DNA-binding transcriptional ArsR family regulator